MEQSKIIQKTFYAQLFANTATSLTQTIGTMVDGVIIGRCLGVDSMAAFGIISPLLVAFSLVGVIVSTGSRNRFTRLVGEGQIERAQGVFSLSVALSVGIATVLMLVFLPLATPFATLLGASGRAAALLPKARNYLIGIAVGLPAMNAVRILNGYMAIDNDRNLPVIASIVLTVSDILFDLIAVFVLHGDTLEVGLATSVSYYVALAVLLSHFRKKNIILRFSFRHIQWRETGGIVAQGLPIGVCRAGYTVRCAFMNGLLAAIASSQAIAAYSVYQRADDFLSCLTIGMADTVAVMAGVLMGEEDRPRMKRLLYTSVQATLLITLGVSVLGFALAPQFAALYIRGDAEALLLSIRAVRAYVVGMSFYGLSLIYLNYFQGIGRSRLSSATGFLSESGFLMLSAGLLSIPLGADAVWFAFPATQLLMYLLYAVIIAVESRRLKIRTMTLWDRALLLPADFDAADSDRMDRSIKSMDEVAALSKAVWDFCEAHGCDKRRTYLMSLSVEEMAGNVIEHGFTKDKQKHSIDIRILKKGIDYIVCIRDDCLIFDPVQQLSLFTDEDPVRHMGLRMVVGLAKEVRYTCILKLNNLMVRV